MAYQCCRQPLPEQGGFKLDGQPGQPACRRIRHLVKVAAVSALALDYF